MMVVTLHTPDTIYSARHTPSWFLLAGASGMVNGYAFLTSQQFVTHVTGTVTRMGLELPHIVIAAEYAAVVVSFIAGAVASVVWIQARAYRGKRPRWATPLVFVAVVLIGTGIAGQLGAFGRFGGQLAADPPPAALLALLAFAMGLQNAAVASTTGLAVRTTHLTGPATDLGIHLGAALFATGTERRAALKGATLRGGKILSFMGGAGLSVPLAQWAGHLSLIAPAVFVLIASALSFIPNWSPSDFPFNRQSPSSPHKERHSTDISTSRPAQHQTFQRTS
jgi:uncharacterized membrane protein YoaK (UPF0700 family)